MGTFKKSKLHSTLALTIHNNGVLKFEEHRLDIFPNNVKNRRMGSVK